MKYFIISMEDLSLYSGYIPSITTSIGHAINGTTIIGFSDGTEPSNLDLYMTEEEYQFLINQENSGFTVL